MQSNNDIDSRLASFCLAVRAMRNHEFAISVHVWPDQADALDALGQELMQLAQWLNQRFSEFHRLQFVAAEISGGLFAEQVLERVYQAFLGLIPYDRMGCALLSEDGVTLTAIWEKSVYPDQMQLVRGFAAPMAGSSLEALLVSGQTRILNDLTRHLAANPYSAATQLMLSEGIRSSLTCPLIAEGKPIGFLFFSSRECNTYHDCHQDIFRQIAALLSVLLEKSRLYQKIAELNQQLLAAQQHLKQQSTHDGLTGMLNRGAVLDMLQERLQSGPHPARPLVVIMADVDLFKTINDNHGHLAGDAVLRALASAMASCLRGDDTVGRYGGEEFLLLLDETDAAGALQVAERIRLAIAALAVNYGGQTLQVTLSQGVALWMPGEETLDQLLQRADAALYQAKRQGRNCACLAAVVS
jgi:diguanylate cyclase (GGDEF)-like protein